MDLLKWKDMVPAGFYRWGSFNAYPRVPLPYIEVLEHIRPEGMTTPSNMHMLNLAVQCLHPGECYLEVGTWRGATFIGALLGNSARGYAIDDDTMDEFDKDERSSEDAWRENVAYYGMTRRATYIDGSVPAVFETLIVPPVGVYLFDGDKSTPEAAFQGIAGIVPFLSKQAIIFVDDGNEFNNRAAIGQFLRDANGHATTILDLPTPGNVWPQFHNGVIGVLWQA